MLTEGFKLMVAGMGTVFIFLVLMIFIIEGLAKVLAPFAGILEKKEIRAPRTSGKTSKTNDKALVSAIISAVHQYRKDRRITK